MRTLALLCLLCAVTTGCIHYKYWTDRRTGDHVLSRNLCGSVTELCRERAELPTRTCHAPFDAPQDPTRTEATP